MKNATILCFLILSLIICCNNNNIVQANHVSSVFVPNNAKNYADPNVVLLTLFYESLCPYSIDFVVNQLYPVMKKYENYLHLDLVPFGNCKMTKNSDGTWTFKCQHGEPECYGNLVHSCVLEQGKQTNSSRTNITEALACLMNFKYTLSDIQTCLEKSSFSYNWHKHCMDTLSIGLEVSYGKRTMHNEPKVLYVPFIMFNEGYNKTLEDIARSNLEYAVCFILGDNRPQKCPDNANYY